MDTPTPADVRAQLARIAADARARIEHANAALTITCPTAPTMPDGTPHTIVGCGSTNVVEDDTEPGVYDCGDCGIFFVAAREGVAA